MIIIRSIKDDESSAPLLLEIESGVKYLTNCLPGVDKQAASVAKQHGCAEAGLRKVSECARDAITKYHKLGGLNNEIYFLTVLKARRPRSRFWSIWFLVKSPLPGL